MKKSKSKSEYKFNLEIFRDRDNKEVKISNFPISKIKLIAEEIMEKYG